MKFSIGIESISLNYEDEGKMLKEVENYGEESINDNMFHLEIQDYNSAMESINAEVDILLKQSDSIVGTEANDTAKKDPIYKRIWKAIKKMFETLGKWINRAYVWIGMRFGFGGSEEASTVAEKETKLTKDVVDEVVDALRPENGIKLDNGESVETAVNKLVTTKAREAISKHHEHKSISWVVPKVVKEVTEQIVEHVEEVEKQVENKTEPEKVVVVKSPDRIGKYTLKLALFDVKSKDLGMTQGSNENLTLARNVTTSDNKVLDPAMSFYFYIPVAVDIIRSVGTCLSCIFEDVKFPYLDWIKLDNITQHKTTDSDVTMINGLIKKLSADVTKIKSSKPKINLTEVTFEIPTVNGKLDINAANKLIYNNDNYLSTKNIGKYILKYSEIIPKHMDEVISKVESIKIEDINNLKDTNESAVNRFKIMKENVVDLKNIASGLIGILGKQNIKALRRTLSKMDNLSNKKK